MQQQKRSANLPTQASWKRRRDYAVDDWADFQINTGADRQKRYVERHKGVTANVRSDANITPDSDKDKDNDRDKDIVRIINTSPKGYAKNSVGGILKKISEGGR